MLAALPPATAAFFNCNDMEPNAAFPPLAELLVTFYTLDFQRRGIVAANVTAELDAPGHIRDAYQEALLLPHFVRGHSDMTVELYSRMTRMFLAGLYREGIFVVSGPITPTRHSAATAARMANRTTFGSASTARSISTAAANRARPGVMRTRDPITRVTAADELAASIREQQRRAVAALEAVGDTDAAAALTARITSATNATAVYRAAQAAQVAAVRSRTSMLYWPERSTASQAVTACHALIHTAVQTLPLDPSDAALFFALPGNYHHPPTSGVGIPPDTPGVLSCKLEIMRQHIERMWTALSAAARVVREQAISAFNRRFAGAIHVDALSKSAAACIRRIVVGNCAVSFALPQSDADSMMAVARPVFVDHCNHLYAAWRRGLNAMDLHALQGVMTAAADADAMQRLETAGRQPNNIGVRALCRFGCGALLWPCEAGQHPICCSRGTTILSEDNWPSIPPELDNVYNNANFQLYCRILNRKLSFIAKGITPGNAQGGMGISRLPGPCCFRMHGVVYYLSVPSTVSGPYHDFLYDTDWDSLFSECSLGQKADLLRLCDLMRQWLRRNHAAADLFRFMGADLGHDDEGAPPAQPSCIAVRHGSQGTVELALIQPLGAAGRALPNDVLFYRDPAAADEAGCRDPTGQGRTFVSRTAPMRMPLAYTLLFPLGVGGWGIRPSQEVIDRHAATQAAAAAAGDPALPDLHDGVASAIAANARGRGQGGGRGRGRVVAARPQSPPTVGSAGASAGADIMGPPPPPADTSAWIKPTSTTGKQFTLRSFAQAALFQVGGFYVVPTPYNLELHNTYTCGDIPLQIDAIPLHAPSPTPTENRDMCWHCYHAWLRSSCLRRGLASSPSGCPT
jgi:hypothetical protein